MRYGAVKERSRGSEAAYRYTEYAQKNAFPEKLALGGECEIIISGAPLMYILSWLSRRVKWY